jgi:hypothetical protein
VSAPAVSALSVTVTCHCFHPRGVTEAGCACPCHTRSEPNPEKAQVGEDQPGAPTVDVAALREALAESNVWRRYGSAGVIEMLLSAGFTFADAELIVLLRNNAEALLDALAEAERDRDEWVAVCQVERRRTRAAEGALAEAERRAAVKALEEQWQELSRSGERRAAATLRVRLNAIENGAPL